LRVSRHRFIQNVVRVSQKQVDQLIDFVGNFFGLGVARCHSEHTVRYRMQGTASGVWGVWNIREKLTSWYGLPFPVVSRTSKEIYIERLAVHST
jgi:hypothetical protein